MDKDGSRPGVKQSVRWVEGYERLAEMAAELPDGQDGFVQASCIVARELQPAAGDKPVEWRLLTNLPARSLEQAARMIDWYRSRWEIEMFFHVLKNGCRIEALQLGSIEKIQRALVLYMVVAWRIARLAAINTRVVSYELNSTGEIENFLMQRIG